LALCRLTGVNPALVLLSFPAFGQIWLGQIDAIVCVGLVIALLAKNPYARGLGIALAAVKPQIAGLAILFMLTRERYLLKVLVIPGAMFVGSLVVFGLSWPLDWLSNVMSDLPVHAWRLASRDVWPFGVILTPLPLLFRGRRPRFEAGLLVSSIATPFFGVYSYIVLLLFRAPWWTVPLSFAWLVAYPLWGSSSMRLAWILPLALLVHLFYNAYKTGGIGRAPLA
jgi:hypothetical protein